MTTRLRQAARRRRACRAALAILAAIIVVAAVSSLVVPEPARAQEATRRTKVFLLRHFTVFFHRPPQFVILGSSRAMRADPSVIGAKLHTHGINLAVGSGAVADAYAFLRLTHSRYPTARPAVLWLLDIEAMRMRHASRYLRSVPSLTQFLSGSSAARALARGSTPAPAQRGAGGAEARARAAAGRHSRWYRNGYLAWCAFDYRRAHGQTAAKRVGYQIGSYARVYRNGGWPGVSAYAKRYATALVREANRLNVTPVIVLTPYHPRLREFIARRGWLKARAQVEAFFRKLARTQRLRLIDMTSITSFGGWPDGFFDGVHQRPALTRKLLRGVLKRAGALLRPGA